VSYLYAVRMLIPGHAFNPVKVGFSTCPERRMRHYDAGPYPCEWLGVWPGTVEDEAAFHFQFKSIRLSGEWFEPNEKFLATINARIQQHREFLASPTFIAYVEQKRSRAMETLAAYYDGPEAA